MSDRKICVTCEYEDASKIMLSDDPDYPGKRYELGVAVWCKFYNKFIGNSDRQGMKKKADSTFEENECNNWKHYQ